jgi:hypothetical protein
LYLSLLSDVLLCDANAVELEKTLLSLYKYMSAEVAPLFARTLKVRFTQPFELNDPFEFRPMLDFVGTAESVRSEIEARIDLLYGNADAALDMLEKQIASDPKFPRLVAPIHVLRKLIADTPILQEKFLEAMKKTKAELLDNTRMAVFWETAWEKVRESFGQAIGVLSLTEDSANILMWSHYASNHFGIVVEFDEGHAWFHQKAGPNDDLRQLLRVSYIQNPRPRRWRELNATDVLYTKTAQWSYEREWRIVRPLKDGIEINPGVFCFDVPPEAIRSIVFGYRMTPDLEAQIREIIAVNPAVSHVKFKRAKLGGDKIELTDATSSK